MSVSINFSVYSAEGVLTIDGKTVSRGRNEITPTFYFCVDGIVPPGKTYVLSRNLFSGGIFTILEWNELY